MKHLKVSALVAGIVSLLVFSHPFFAEAVTVGPVRFEFSVDPGDTVNGDMLLLNEGSASQTFYPSFEKFSENENGEKVFSEEITGLSKWFVIPQEVTLAPGEQRFVPFTLNIPNDAPPGGHFAVMWWGTAPSGGSSQLSIVTRAGVLVYLRVSGDIREEGAIEEFSGNNYFQTGSPLQLIAKFKNTGNVAVSPKGTVTLRNMFGSEKVSVPFNPNGAIALPGTTKNIGTEIPFGEWFFGPYKAEAKAVYGEAGKEISETYWFFAAPWKPLVLFLAVVFFLFVFPPVLKRYNRWVVKKSGAKNS